MTDQPADEIRAAAVKLRTLATNASTDRTDRPTAHWAFTERRSDAGEGRGIGMLRATDHLNPDDNPRIGRPLMHATTGPRGLPPSLAVQHGQYIAAMDPRVGLALAVWLDRTASAWDALNHAADMALDPDDAAHAAAAEQLRGGPYDAVEALAVARLINGEQL